MNMKTASISAACRAFILLGLVVALGGLSLRAQTAKPDSRSFPAFWTEFKAALAANNKQAVASMTRLPFVLNSEELNRDGFIRKFDKIFDKKVKACFAKARPTRDQESYEIFCGEEIFLFMKVQGRYKFVEISAND